MCPEKRQHLQDIYSSERTDQDDFTPQVSSETLEKHKSELRRHRLIDFSLGMMILLLLLALSYVVTRGYIDIHAETQAPTPITQEYIPRYSLASESQWVLDFSRSYGTPEWDGEGVRPFNEEWVRKAAFNLVMAKQAEGIGENDSAAEYYENVLEIFPDIEGVKVLLGMLYFKMNSFDKALTLLENAPEEDMTPDVLNNLGAACINARAYNRAESYIQRAIEAKPAYAEAQKNLAVLYKEQGRKNEAVSAYEKYVDLRPTDVDTRHSFALYLAKIGRWEQAADVINRLTEEITDVPVLFYLLAQVEMKNNRPDKAMIAIKRGSKLSDPNATLLYMDSSEFDQLRNSEEFQMMIRTLERVQK